MQIGITKVEKKGFYPWYSWQWSAALFLFFNSSVLSVQLKFLFSFNPAVMLEWVWDGLMYSKCIQNHNGLENYFLFFQLLPQSLVIHYHENQKRKDEAWQVCCNLVIIALMCVGLCGSWLPHMSFPLLPILASQGQLSAPNLFFLYWGRFVMAFHFHS